MGSGFNGNKAVVEFDHVGVRLMTGGKDGRKPVEEMKGDQLAWFAAAG